MPFEKFSWMKSPNAVFRFWHLHSREWARLESWIDPEQGRFRRAIVYDFYELNLEA